MNESGAESTSRQDGCGAVVNRRGIIKVATWASGITVASSFGASPASASSAPLAPIQVSSETVQASVPTEITTQQLSATYAPLGLTPSSAKPRKPLVSNIISTFSPGHGWYNYNGAINFTPNDNTDFALGTQSIKFASDASNTPAIIRSPLLSVDATGKQFIFWIKIEGVANLTEMNLYAGDSNLANHYNWTIADNGGLAQQVFREGEWTPIVVGFADGSTIGAPTRSSLKLIQFRIRSSYGTSVTAHLGGIGFTAELATFPRGIISLTCDDSYLSQFTQLKTALDQYGWGATAYTIVDRIGLAGFMNLDHLRELEQVHGWEVGGHSYTMANHAIGYGNMSIVDVETDIKSLKSWLIDNGFIGAEHMAYPLGSYSVASQSVIGKYFATGRTITSRLAETIRPSDRMRLRSMSLSNTTLLSTAKAFVDRIASQRGWGIITFHEIVSTPTLGTHWSIADTFALVDYIATKDVSVVNVGDVSSRLTVS